MNHLDSEILKSIENEGPKFIALCSDIVSAIQNQSLSIIDLIQQLGCLLTDQSFTKREKGVNILAEVLQNLNPHFLNAEQLGVLTSYLVEKVKDQHQIVPHALKGLQSCIKCKNLPPTAVFQILSAIFQHVSCQQQQQPDRFNIYQIFEVSVKNYSSEIQSLGYDFVYGIISSIDGERDPNNLRYLFSWMPTCLRIIKLGHLTEEMFEVLACYFPVDFKAPPSDPNKITRQELADGLRDCLTVIPNFGESALDLAVEKFESDLKIAKEDSLEILKKGCQNFETSVYSDHSIEIWSNLQNEIFKTNDEQLRFQCLDTFSTVIEKLSRGNEEKFVEFLTNITDTLKGNLIPTQKLFWPSSWILVSIAKPTKKSSIVVANKIIPLLENTFRITSNSKHKAEILSVCVELAKAVIKNEVYSVENFKVPLVCLQAINDQNQNLRSEGYKGLSSIAKILNETERNVLYENLSKSIIFDNDTTVRPSILKCLNDIGSIYPEEIKLNVITNQKIQNLYQLDNYLEALCALSKQKSFHEFIVNQLLTNLNNPEQTQIALEKINKIVGISKDLDKLCLEKDFIQKLTHVATRIHQRINKNFLDNLSLTLNKIIRSQPSENQADIFSKHSKEFIQDNVVSIAILKGLLISIKPDVLKNFQEDITQQFLKIYLKNEDEFVKDSCVKILANVLNKMENGLVLQKTLSQIEETCLSNSHIRHDILTWITKALVIKNHPEAYSWVDKILENLESSIELCNGLKIILNDNCEELSRDNHCQVMPLYRQKFYVYCTNKIAEKYQPEKTNYLIAVGSLVEFAPAQAVAAQFKKILKLVIHCLEKCEDTNVLVTLLVRIEEFVEKGEKSIEDNLEDILLRVLNLTSFETSMKVRIAALRCLSKFPPNFEIYKLLPLKEKVTKHLGACVDDKKRLVRKEAMETRSVWYLLDAPV